MAPLIHQLLLVVAVAGLGGAGLRLASLAAPDGLERLLAAFTIGAAMAAAEAIGLGLVGAGGDTAALTAAALATWLAVRVFVPGPPATVRLRVPWAVGAAGGIVFAWIVWQLRHPLIGPDALTYHLPIASAWVQNGRPGSVVDVMNGFPFGNYPLTNETLVAWVLGISRSWVVVSIWSPVLWVAVVAGGWVTLRELGVTTCERALAVVALGIPPLIVGQLGAPYTDIAALAWLAVTAGLATAARRRPGLIYPAVLAAALCVGTKTTPAILVLALGVVAWRPLRTARARWLLPTFAVAVVVGGVWSIRDLIDHGSPLWPLLAAPWGDPIPAAFHGLEGRFLDHPRHLLGAYWRDYLSVLGGCAVLIGGGIVLPVVRRSRTAVFAAVVAGAALLAWGEAPYTGLVQFGAVGAIANTRYLLPAIAACTLALAVSSVGAGPRVRLLVRAALVAAIAYSVDRTAAFGPLRPSLATLVAAAAAGTAALAVARRAPVGFDRRIVGGALGLACVAGLAIGAHGYVRRYLAADNPPDRALYALPAVRDPRGPIASSPGVFVLLRGDRLEHQLALIGAREGCAAVQARLRSGPVVVTPAARAAAACLRGVPGQAVGADEQVFG